MRQYKDLSVVDAVYDQITTVSVNGYTRLSDAQAETLNTFSSVWEDLTDDVASLYGGQANTANKAIEDILKRIRNSNNLSSICPYIYIDGRLTSTPAKANDLSQLLRSNVPPLQVNASDGVPGNGRSRIDFARLRYSPIQVMWQNYSLDPNFYRYAISCGDKQGIAERLMEIADRQEGGWGFALATLGLYNRATGHTAKARDLRALAQEILESEEQDLVALLNTQLPIIRRRSILPGDKEVTASVLGVAGRRRFSVLDGVAGRAGPTDSEVALNSFPTRLQR